MHHLSNDVAMKHPSHLFQLQSPIKNSSKQNHTRRTTAVSGMSSLCFGARTTCRRHSDLCFQRKWRIARVFLGIALDDTARRYITLKQQYMSERRRRDVRRRVKDKEETMMSVWYQCLNRCLWRDARRRTVRASAPTPSRFQTFRPPTGAPIHCPTTTTIESIYNNKLFFFSFGK